MMSFLAPAALTGLLLLAIPVAVHLFKPRKMRQTSFSSLRWLRASQQKLSRRIRWHQIVLFLLRAAFVLLLVLALARPLVAPNAESKYTDRFIVVDVGRSMAYQAPGRQTPLEQAKQVAAQILRHGRAGDRTALLLTGSTTQVVTPPTVDAPAYVPALEGVQAGATDTNLSSALSVIRPMLAHCRPASDVELYFLTNNQQGSWSQPDIAAFRKDLPVPVTVRIVDVGIKGAPNGWIAGARLVTQTGGSTVRRLVHVELGCTGDLAQERTLRLLGVQGLAEQEQAVVLEPGRSTTVNYEVPADLDLRQQVAELRLEPPDALPSDDRYWLNLDTTAALRVLLVEADAPADGASSSGLHLAAAIGSLAQADRALDLVRRSASSVTPRDFSEAHVTFLAAVPELMPPQLEALENRVQAGAGLVMFLGPQLRLDFYNNRLCKPLQPAAGLLAAPLKSEQTAQHGSTAPLANIRWTHRLLAPLNDPVLGDLGGTRFRCYYRFTGNPAESDQVLAWIDDEVPGIIERPLGAGKVILINTTANDDWSDLPRRKSFVPLVDRLLTYLSAGNVRRNFEAGETVTLPLSDLQPGEALTVHAPGGGILTPAIGGSGARTFLRLGAVTEPGVYRVERPGGKGFPFVVNVSARDSVLISADPATLASWFEPAPLEVLDPATAEKRLAWNTTELALWPWLVGVAGLFLVAETFFVHWLCPRMNPALANVVVHRRGLLRPVENS